MHRPRGRGANLSFDKVILVSSAHRFAQRVRPNLMGDMKLGVAMTPNKQGLSIALFDGDTMLGQVALDAAALEKHIQALGMRRSEMAEQVAPTLEPGARLFGLENPAWLTFMDDGGPPNLALRHACFGWLSFAFSPESARLLGVSLVRIADQADGGSPQYRGPPTRS